MLVLCDDEDLPPGRRTDHVFALEFDVWEVYDEAKKEIARSCTSSEEYEARIKQLVEILEI